MATKTVAPAKQPRASAPAKKSRQASDSVRRQIDAASSHGHRFYVYTLADDDGVFYVGKGQRSRVFAHGKTSDMCNPHKLCRIAKSHGSVRRSIVAFCRTEAGALLIERDWIAAYRGELTNIASGGIHHDYVERTRAFCASMLAKAIPLDQYKKPSWLTYCTEQDAKSLYARLLEAIRREMESPTPRYLEADPVSGTIKAVY